MARPKKVTIERVDVMNEILTYKRSDYFCLEAAGDRRKEPVTVFLTIAELQALVTTGGCAAGRSDGEKESEEVNCNYWDSWPRQPAGGVCNNYRFGSYRNPPRTRDCTEADDRCHYSWRKR